MVLILQFNFIYFLGTRTTGHFGASINSLLTGHRETKEIGLSQMPSPSLPSLQHCGRSGVCMVGLKDQTFSLFGFGLDSFVEVISAVGVWHMLRRQAKSHESEHDAFERTALRITGTSFYLLAAGLLLTAAVNIYQGHKPETTIWGTIIGAISIASSGSDPL